jgi:hypothetical protein
MEMILFFVGLGFFIFIIWMVQVAEERMYQRKLNETREFGYRFEEPDKPTEPPSIVK